MRYYYEVPELGEVRRISRKGMSKKKRKYKMQSIYSERELILANLDDCIACGNSGNEYYSDDVYGPCNHCLRGDARIEDEISTSHYGLDAE